jgi:hypothetical protein
MMKRQASCTNGNNLMYISRTSQDDSPIRARNHIIEVIPSVKQFVSIHTDTRQKDYSTAFRSFSRLVVSLINENDESSIVSHWLGNVYRVTNAQLICLYLYT